MTGRDLAWRIAGSVLLAGGCVIARLADGGITPTERALAILGFVLAVTGLVLAVQGRRVALALRIERSRHRALPAALRARHRRPR